MYILVFDIAEWFIRLFSSFWRVSVSFVANYESSIHCISTIYAIWCGIIMMTKLLKINHDSCFKRISTLFCVCLCYCCRKSISSLFVNSAGSLPNTMVGSVAGIQGSAALKRASSLRRAWTSGTAAIKRKSLCLQIKFQVVGILLLRISAMKEMIFT